MTVSFHIWPLHLKVMVKESLWDKCDKLSFCCRRPGGASLQAGAEGAAVLCPKLVRSSLRIHALLELYQYSAGSQGAGVIHPNSYNIFENILKGNTYSTLEINILYAI